MSIISSFDESGDVMSWSAQVRAKLIAKGYKNYLYVGMYVNALLYFTFI